MPGARPASIIPMIHALLAKGAALGTALAFMMSDTDARRQLTWNTGNTDTLLERLGAKATHLILAVFFCAFCVPRCWVLTRVYLATTRTISRHLFE